VVTYQSDHTLPTHLPLPSCLPFSPTEMHGWLCCLQVLGAAHVVGWSSIHRIKRSSIWIIVVCCLSTLVACVHACGGVRYAISVLYDIVRWSHLQLISQYLLINMITNCKAPNGLICADVHRNSRPTRNYSLTHTVTL